MKKNVSLLYKFLFFLVKLFSPKFKAYGTENIPNEPVVFVGNHCQLYGPIASEIYMPVPRYTWCAGQMMELKEVPDYAFQDFWSGKPTYIRWFYRLLSYVIAPFSVCIFNNANTIAVHRDTRIISTFKESIRVLQSGSGVVIFPEHNAEKNNIICKFEDRFIDIAKLYHKKTEHELCFVPMYISPRLKGIYFGEPIRYCSTAPAEEERRRICTYLENEVTDIAQKLPKHTVVPYLNIPKKDYPTNI